MCWFNKYCNSEQFVAGAKVSILRTPSCLRCLRKRVVHDDVVAAGK